MTNKEALRTIANTKTNHIKSEKIGQPRIMYLVKEERKKELECIKKDLDRLEVLERNSDKVIKDSVNLMNRNLELQQRLEMLEQSSDTLSTIAGNQLATIHNLIEENEKLKKTIATIKEHVQFIIKPIESNDPVLEGVYHFGIKVDGKYGYYTTLYKDEAIVLKEVLGDA